MSARLGPPRTPEPWSDEDFLPVASVLRARPHAGELTSHRLNLIRSRLEMRLRARDIPSFRWFHERHLRARSDGPGVQLLIDLSTVNHTTFFREPMQLEALADYLAEISRSRPPSFGPIRVWSAGCSGGQEPVSLAILLAERMPDLNPSRLEIRASDVSLEVVRSAASAIYDTRELADISADRLRRFFLRGRGSRRGRYRVVPEIRDLIVYQHFDLRSPEWPVAGDFEAILCRNVSIYFNETERLQLLDRLGRHLRPGGWLVVGNCEILPERPGLLAKIAPSIFRRDAT